MKLVFAVVAVLGCSKADTPKTHAACENVVEQCAKAAWDEAGVKFTRVDIPKCMDDLARQAPDFGDKYEPMLQCMTEASSCLAIFSCFPAPKL